MGGTDGGPVEGLRYTGLSGQWVGGLDGMLGGAGWVTAGRVSVLEA